MELYKAIDEARRSIGKIQKSGFNPHFKSNYMTLEGIYGELNKALLANNLIVQQAVNGEELMTEVLLKGTDEKITVRMPLIGANNMQQLGSAITYARRYSLVALFGIIDKDDDAEVATHGDQVLVAKQQELVSLINDNIDIAQQIKKDLSITNTLTEMSEKELDAMIKEAKERL